MDVLFTNMGKLECSKPFNNLLQNSGEVETHLTNAKPSNAFHIFDIYQRQLQIECQLTLPPPPLSLQSTTPYLLKLLVRLSLYIFGRTSWLWN